MAAAGVIDSTIFNQFGNKDKEEYPIGFVILLTERFFSIRKILNIFAVPIPRHPNMKYKRLLLKLSGEALMGKSKATSLDHEVLEQYSREIMAIKEYGVEIAIVIGGGNIFRGGQAEALGIDR